MCGLSRTGSFVLLFASLGGGCTAAPEEHQEQASPAQHPSPDTVLPNANAGPGAASTTRTSPSRGGDPQATAPAAGAPATRASASDAMPTSAAASTVPAAGASAQPPTSPQSTDASPTAMSAAQGGGPAAPAASPRNVVSDLQAQVLATWGSSVCDGYSVPSGTGWPWLLEKRLAEVKGPKVSHVSTPGHNTDSKDSALERNKVQGAQFVVVCLSLGNQGLGSATTEASAQAVVDSYLDDIFTDHNDNDGDPKSMVDFIAEMGAHPIVTLVYPMADYNTMHCRHVVEANILQQSLGVATINHLGTTNAGNNFGSGDCTWANGSNAPLNVQSDARHPIRLGHEESFYGFPPDLPFALASHIPFPTRPASTDYFTLAPTQPSAEPIRYTPEHPLHSYTVQLSLLASADGTIATVELGMNGVISLEIKDGAVHLVSDDAKQVLHGSQPVSDGAWHDVAVTYSYVRQKLALYVDGVLSGEHDARDGTSPRELFPQSFVVAGPASSGRAAAPTGLQLRDLFINRSALHAREIEERAKTAWVGSGSLDVYAPLRASDPAENRAQTLQMVRVHN